MQAYKFSIRWGQAHTFNIFFNIGVIPKTTLFLQDEGLEAESKVEICFKSQVS